MEEEELRSTQRNNKHRDDDDDIIIPDLDEDGRGFGGGRDSRIAQAPRNVVRKIPTLDELERDVQSTLPTVSAAISFALSPA